MALNTINIILVEFPRNMGMGHMTQNEGKQHKQITYDISFFNERHEPNKENKQIRCTLQFLTTG